MRKKIKLLISAVLLLSLSACGSKEIESSRTQVENTDEKAGGMTAGTRIVVDTWGREVEIPEKVSSIICLGSGAPRIAAYLNAVDMMVGAEEHDIQNATVLRDYNPVHHASMKDLPAVGAGGGSGNNNGYPEELIMLAPDVILAGFSVEAADELYAQTNIPVVCVRYTSNELANETFYSAMRVFAEVTDRQERCEAVLSFVDECKEDLNQRTGTIDDSGKLKAYTGAVTFNGRHGFAGTYAKFGPFMLTNVLNVADEIDEAGYYEVDLEKVVVWDPDIIFLDPGNMDLVHDEYKTRPDYFNSLRAVNEGQVYTMPSFNNCSMNITYALIDSYYAGLVLYPEQFADVEIEEKAREILTFFLGEDIYETMVEGGLYYGKIEIEN